MRIGELARRAGTSTRALRHYEDAGLLTARRRANGYRDYDETDLRLVHEIRALLAVGFSLAETRPFVECLRSGHATGLACPDAAAVYRRRIDEIDACVARLAVIRAGLALDLEHELAHRGRDPETTTLGRPVDGSRAADARAVPVPAAAPACAFVR